MFLYIIREMNFFFKSEKPHFLHKKTMLFYELLWTNLGPSLTISVNLELISEIFLANAPNS